jgi:hypothetical protein
MECVRPLGEERAALLHPPARPPSLSLSFAVRRARDTCQCATRGFQPD